MPDFGATETVTVNGPLVCRGGVTLPANVIGNNQFSSTSPLEVEKMVHQYYPRDGQPHGTAAVAVRKVLHIARAAGVLLEFIVQPVVAAVGDSTVTVDLYKNGSSILTGTITINNGKAAFSITSGTFSATPYVVNDTFEVVQTISAGSGTLPQGMNWQLKVKEAQ